MKGIPQFGKWLAILAACSLISLPASAQLELPAPGSVKFPDAPEEKTPLRQLDRNLELKKAIDEAMRADDPQKALDLVLKLQKQILVQRGGAFQLQLAPFPVGRDPGPVPKSELREQYEKQLREFAESIDKLKDDKEAREGIEKARDEYKKAMEAELKKADEARPQPNFPRLQLQPLPAPLPFADFGDFNFRLGGAQPRLGVQLEKPSGVLAEQLDLKPDTGLVIVDVMRGMPAEKAGLKKNDVLLQWAGKEIATDVEAFQTMIAEAKAGEKVDAVILRKGKKETIKGIEIPEAAKAPEARPRERDNFNQVQTQINGDTATIQASARGVKYNIAGAMEGRKIMPKKIVITDRDETTTFESLNKVPEKYRATVDKLLGKVGRE